jgi:hypothetical protein
MRLTVRHPLCFCAGVAAILVVVPLCNAQGEAQSVFKCKAADLNATFAFTTTDDGHQSVIFNVRNISSAGCLLRNGGVAGFGDLKLAHSIDTQSCFECDANGKPNFARLSRFLDLAAGAEAHSVYRWATASGDVNQPCEDVDDMSVYVDSNDQRHGYRIISESLITRVCSTVQISNFQDGSLGLSDSEGLAAGQRAPTLTTDKTDNAPTELVVLHIGADTRGRLDKNFCPIIFLSTRSEDGETRFQELPWAQSCTNVGSAKFSPDGLLKKDLIGPQSSTSGIGVPGKLTVTVSTLAGRTDAGLAVMLRSDPLNLRIVDESALKREWSPSESGLRIALNLDRDTYSVGEDVHLHVATEDVSASEAIVWNDCDIPVRFEVWDALGRQIKSRGPTNGYPTREFGGMCHGGAIPFLKGKPVTWEHTLREWGILPDVPGEFTVVATWKAMAEPGTSDPKPHILRSALQNYAVVRSRAVTFRITKEHN